MYAKLKQDMRSANVPVSDGDDLVNSDLQLVRDFLYFNGINIGEEFHRYEEVVHGTVAAAPESDADADSTDGEDVGPSDISGDGTPDTGTPTINGATQEPVEEDAAPEQEQAPAPAPAVEDAAPEQEQA